MWSHVRSGSMANGLAILLAGLTLAVADDFQIGELNRADFGLIQGADLCPTVISFDDNDFSILAEDMEINKKPCTGSSLTLSLNPDAGGSLLTSALRKQSNRGDSAEGVTQGPIQCDQFKMNSVTYFQIFSPTADFELNFGAILGKNAPLTDNVTENTKFLDSNDYLILGAECMFSRTAFFRTACFPGTATVQLSSGETRLISDVSTGDSVLTSNGQYSPIFAWTHRDPHPSALGYIALHTADHKLTLTPGHYVYIAGRNDDTGVPARDVRVGDVLFTTSGPQRVRHRTRVAAKGLYNPQTLHGDIVVDGVLASTYTTAVHPAAAHALLWPARAGYTLYQKARMALAL